MVMVKYTCTYGGGRRGGKTAATEKRIATFLAREIDATIVRCLNGGEVRVEKVVQGERVGPLLIQDKST